MRLHTIRGRRFGRAILAATLMLLSLAVALHHSGLEMAGGHADHRGHGDHGSVASMCIGMAVETVALGGLLLVRSIRRPPRHRRRPTTRRTLVPTILPGREPALARAGPPLHLQLCVLRR